MGQGYETTSVTTTSSPSTDSGEVASELDLSSADGLGQAPGGGNQAALTLGASTDDGLVCDGSVELDDIMGEGMSEAIDGCADDTVSAVARVWGALAQWQNGELDEYEVHPNGAEGLIGWMYEQVEELLSTACWDEEGEVVYDEALYDSVLDAMNRCEAAQGNLQQVELIANEPQLRALATLLSEIGALGGDFVESLLIQAETGHRMLSMLVSSFAKHQGLFEKYRNSAARDAIDLAMPGIASMGEGAARIKLAYDFWKQMDSVTNAPQDVWGTVKAFKTWTWTGARMALDSLGPEVVKATPWIGLAIDAFKATMDLSLASAELAVMNELLQQAIEVKEEYGAIMAFCEGNAALIALWVSFFGRLEGAVNVVDTVLESAKATIEGNMAGWGGKLYEPASG